MSGVESVSDTATSGAGTVNVELAGGDLTYRLLRPQDHPEAVPLPQSDPLVPYVAYDAVAEISGISLADPVTLLVLPNEHAPASRVSTDPFATNEHVEATWLEARTRLAGGDIPGVSALDPVFDRTAGAVPRRHPPLTFCRKVGAYFSPVCPTCLGPMETCRDDALLHRLYLKRYTSSLARYLYCRVCSEQDPVTVYTYELRDTSRGKGSDVRRRGQLYRDLAMQIKSTQARRPEGHPCFSCAHRETCYPAGADGSKPVPAEDVLVPIAYYDFEFLPVHRASMSFDDAAQLLGGGSTLEGELARDGRELFLFRNHRAGLFEAEVLALKLRAFGTLVRAVAAIHRRERRPHLGLAHDRVGANLASESGSPAAWGVSFEARDMLGGARDSDAPSSEDTLDVWSPAYATTAAYLPAAARTPPVEQLWMSLRKASISPVDQEVVSLEARLAVDDGTAPAIGRHDVLALELPLLASTPAVAVGRADRSDSGNVHFVGEIQGADAALVARLHAEGIPPGRAGLTVRRVRHVPVDVHALGVLLARLLFRNDADPTGAPSPDAMEAAAETIAKTQAAGVAPDVPAIWSQVGLAADPVSILYRMQDRESCQGTIPPDIWSDVLLLATRMASNVEGFSVCESMDDFPAESPEEPLQHVLGRLEGLGDRLRALLFGAGGRNHLVLQVLEDYYVDYLEAVAGEEGETSTSGFKTIIGRKPG